MLSRVSGLETPNIFFYMYVGGDLQGKKVGNHCHSTSVSFQSGICRFHFVSLCLISVSESLILSFIHSYLNCCLSSFFGISCCLHTWRLHRLQYVFPSASTLLWVYLLSFAVVSFAQALRRRSLRRRTPPNITPLMATLPMVSSRKARPVSLLFTSNLSMHI